MFNPADRLIVALDVPGQEAFNLVETLKYQALSFKIGVAAFLEGTGPFLIDHIRRKSDGHVFVDLKLYDTPDTVKRVVRQVESLGVSFLTVLPEALVPALEAEQRDSLKILVVPYLTSSPRMASKSDVTRNHPDGIVCHPRAAAFYKRYRPEAIVVSPGIRPEKMKSDNHFHPATPYEAIKDGADYIVVGRPIYAAPDPVAATRAITREIEAALGSTGERGER